MMHGLLSLSGRAQRRGWVLGVQEPPPATFARWGGVFAASNGTMARDSGEEAPQCTDPVGRFRLAQGVRAALRVDGVDSLDEANHPASAP
jgi:hypothetical protein